MTCYKKTDNKKYLYEKWIYGNQTVVYEVFEYKKRFLKMSDEQLLTVTGALWITENIFNELFYIGRKIEL
jgi:hypothetical protein